MSLNFRPSFTPLAFALFYGAGSGDAVLGLGEQARRADEYHDRPRLSTSRAKWPGQERHASVISILAQEIDTLKLIPLNSRKKRIGFSA